jgi:hypothetical protein
MRSRIRPAISALLAFALLGAAALPAAAAGKAPDDPSIRLVNHDSRAVVEFFASPSGRTNWGQNRLGSSPLAPAAARLIRIAKTGDCLFDLRVVFADHAAKENHHVNLCRITDLPVP